MSKLAASPADRQRCLTAALGLALVLALVALVAPPALAQARAELLPRGLRLTHPMPRRVGSYWHPKPMPVAAGLITAFRFRISSPGGNPDANGINGGDGIAFVVQASGPGAVGGDGGDIGYAGIPRSIAIEFDTFYNEHDGGPGRDDGSAHVSVHTRGAAPNSASHRHSIASTQAVPVLSDGEEHIAIIDWRDDVLKVYVDDCRRPVLSVRIAVADALGGRVDEAWVGFTAATGVAWEYHDVLSWRLAPVSARYPIIALCSGDTMRFEAPSGFDWYSWSTGSMDSHITVSEPGTYRLTAWFDGYCDFTITLDHTITRIGRPRPVIAGNTYICPDSTTLLDAGAGYVSYLWTTGERTRTIRVKGPALVAVETVDDQGCRTRSDTANVVLRRPPRPVIRARGPSVVCDGDSVVLDAGAGYLHYRWSTGAEGRFLITSVPGFYSVVVTDSGGCSGASAPLSVAIAARPVVVAATEAARLCAGESTVLRASGAQSYRWIPAGGLDCDTCASTIARPDRTTTYVVTGTSIDGCTAVDSVTIVVSDAASADAGRDTSVCEGGSVRLEARGGGTYRWEPSEGLSCATCPDPIARPRQTTLYRVHVDEESACGGVDSVLVTVRSAPAIDAGANVAICAGDSARLSVTGGVSWLWDPPEGLSCTDCATPTASPAATTLYRVTAVSEGGCTSRDSVLVTVHEPPVADAGGDVEICRGMSVKLSAGGGIGYSWSPSEGLDCDTCATPSASPATTTRYRVVVTSADGCTDDDDVVVRVREPVEAALSVERSHRVAPGDSTLVPVLLRPSSGGPAAGPLVTTVEVDPRVARIGGVRTDGTLFDGATISTLERTSGALRLRVDGAFELKSDTLLRVMVSGYLAGIDSTPVRVAVATEPQSCLLVTSAEGLLRVDSICGLRLRLIDVLDGQWMLKPARPNPFTLATTIDVGVAVDGHVRLALLDAGGREIAVLVDEHRAAGMHSVTLEAAELPSGVYTCRLEANGFTATRRLVLVR